MAGSSNLWKRPRRVQRRAGFTLTELLVTLGILTLLAALLFPAFALVRGRSRMATCASNLHQLGQAATLYEQDNENLFPRCADPLDLNTTVWASAGSKYWPLVQTLPPIQSVLLPYAKDAELFDCPSDTGFDYSTMAPGFPLAARPTSYGAFGTSYYYHTELPLDGLSIANLTAIQAGPPLTEVGPDSISLLFDGTDQWHGGRLNVLYVDGHVKSQSQDQLDASWNQTLQ